MNKTINNSSKQNKYICIQCGSAVRELYKQFSNSLKTVHCKNCHKVADKYIEFDSIIILVDSVLLSEQTFRHMIYNSDFKLHWKLSIMLLLLESFALWRQKRFDFVDLKAHDLPDVNEKAFYLCCLQNIADYAIITLLLLMSTRLQGRIAEVGTNISSFCFTLMKAVAIANFSKFFLLPIMIWRKNTTELGTAIHHLLVMCHHLLSLIFVYAVVSRQRKWHAALIVLPAFLLKQYLKSLISAFMEEQLNTS